MRRHGHRHLMTFDAVTQHSDRHLDGGSIPSNWSEAAWTVAREMTWQPMELSDHVNRSGPTEAVHCHGTTPARTRGVL